VFPSCRVCGHRDLSPDRNGNGEIEPEEWMKACPCFDAEQEFKEFAAEDTEETQSKLNYLQNKKGGK
ncbi:N-acetylmuramoyl-L-alanine amidase, partial [Bacteroides thetaiotaomicron]